MPHISGFTYLRFTPKMAGSVIPKAADKEEGIATDFVFNFLAFKPTAKHAAP